MDIRLAHPNEVTEIMTIIEQARAYIASYGSDQWQNGYPDSHVIIDDIISGRGYVALLDGQLAAYTAVISGGEPAYDAIYDGSWQNPDSHAYVTFHRIAVAETFRGQGVIKTFLEGLIEGHEETDYRCDTHPQNLAMQHIFKVLGFEERGKVTFDSMRLAYQKLK